MVLRGRIAALLVWTCSAAPKVPGLDHWVGPTTETVRPGTLGFGAARQASLVAARGEREAFFVVLPGAEPGKTRVQWSGDLGPAQLRVWRAAWVEVEGRRLPDALIPLNLSVSEVAGTAPVKRGDDLVLYVEVSVPSDAAPGRYTGSVHVVANGGEARVPVTLTVVPLELPERPSLVAAFNGDSEAGQVGTPGYSLRSIGWTAWIQRGGDGVLHAPGGEHGLFYALRSPAEGGPQRVESVRLKLLQDGLEDYELLRATDRAGKGVLARVLAMRMTRHPEVMDFEAVRSELFKAIAE